MSDTPPPRPRPRRSPLSQADRAAAGALRALWDARPDPRAVTQQTVADILDVSQSAVSQFLTGRMPLHYRAVMAFAIALDIDSSLIRHDLPEQQLQLMSTDSEPRRSITQRQARAEAREAEAQYRMETKPLKPDELALIRKYRAADKAGKASLQAVGDALAKPPALSADKAG